VARRLAIVFLGFSSPLLLVTSVLGGAWAEVVFVLVVMAFPVALIVFAVAHREGIGPLALPLLVLLLILEGCGVALLLLRGHVIDGPWLGGLPLAAAIQLWGLFLAPLLLVALAYALTFDQFGIREEDLRRLRSLRRDREAQR
jgi:hypothetical protein